MLHYIPDLQKNATKSRSTTKNETCLTFPQFSSLVYISLTHLGFGLATFSRCFRKEVVSKSTGCGIYVGRFKVVLRRVGFLLFYTLRSHQQNGGQLIWPLMTGRWCKPVEVEDRDGCPAVLRMWQGRLMSWYHQGLLNYCVRDCRKSVIQDWMLPRTP